MMRNYLLLAGVMGVLVVAVHMVGYDKAVTVGQGVDIVKQIPLTMDTWTGVDHALDPVVFDILETRAILHRSYENPRGAEVFLSLVYYAETKVDFHAPEGCLGGQGIKTEKTPATLNIKGASGVPFSLAVNRLIQKDQERDTLVYYFYKTGDFVGRNYIRLRLNLVMNKFKGAPKSGCLIRVSTPMAGPDGAAAAHEYLENFIGLIFPYLTAYL